MNPSDHAGSWWSLDPHSLALSVRRAQELIATPHLKSQINNPLNKGATEFVGFGKGVENLGFYTASLVWAIHEAAKNGMSAEHVEQEVASMSKHHRFTLQRLGIVSKEASSSETNIVASRVIRHIVGTFLTVEEIHPSSDNKTRKDNLTKIAQNLSR